MPKLPKIAVIDYQSGNLRSVVKALEAVGLESSVTSDPVEVANATALILPGVGSGQSAMDSLKLGPSRSPSKFRKLWKAIFRDMPWSTAPS